MIELHFLEGGEKYKRNFLPCCLDICLLLKTLRRKMYAIALTYPTFAILWYLLGLAFVLLLNLTPPLGEHFSSSPIF